MYMITLRPYGWMRSHIGSVKMPCIQMFPNGSWTCCSVNPIAFMCIYIHHAPAQSVSTQKKTVSTSMFLFCFLPYSTLILEIVVFKNPRRSAVSEMLNLGSSATNSHATVNVRESHFFSQSDVWCPYVKPLRTVQLPHDWLFGELCKSWGEEWTVSVDWCATLPDFSAMHRRVSLEMLYYVFCRQQGKNEEKLV